MKDIVIVGHGGLAQEFCWMIERINKQEKTWNLLGFIDQSLSTEVIGNDEWLMKRQSETNVILGIGSSSLRYKLFHEYRNNPMLQFPNIVDPSAVLSDKIMAGIGNVICAGSILTVNITLGDCNIINLNCTIGHGTAVENFVTVNPGVHISGDVRLEDMCTLGTGAQIIQGRSIGARTTIGAGAVVIHDIPSHSLAVGIPARVVKKIEQ